MTVAAGLDASVKIALISTVPGHDAFAEPNEGASNVRHVAVILGAASPLGRLLSASLAMRGDTVILWDSDLTELDRMAERLRGYGASVRVEAAHLDLPLLDALLETATALVDARVDASGRLGDVDVVAAALMASRRLGADSHYVWAGRTARLGVTRGAPTRLEAAFAQNGTSFAVFELADDSLDAAPRLVPALLDAVLDEGAGVAIEVGLRRMAVRSSSPPAKMSSGLSLSAHRSASQELR